MARYLHTMVRVTDPEASRAFYEALGMEFRRDLPIVRDGELEATNYFLGFPGEDPELELTFNHDGRTYDLGTAYGHVAIGVDDLDATLERLKSWGSSRSGRPTPSATAALGSASCATPTTTASRSSSARTTSGRGFEQHLCRPGGDLLRLLRRQSSNVPEDDDRLPAERRG